MNEALAKVQKQIMDREREWWDATAERFLPPVIVRWVRNRQNLSQVARWLEKQGYKRRVHHDGKIEFAKGDTILATLEPVKFS